MNATELYRAWQVASVGRNSIEELHRLARLFPCQRTALMALVAAERMGTAR